MAELQLLANRLTGAAATLPLALERQFGFRIAGLLGQGFIGDGVLTLDFPAMRVSLA
jgi:hypothetical protein